MTCREITSVRTSISLADRLTGAVRAAKLNDVTRIDAMRTLEISMLYSLKKYKLM